MSKRYEISYKLLHGNSSEELEIKVIKLLKDCLVESTHIEYWETKGGAFYAHTGVAQTMVKYRRKY